MEKAIQKAIEGGYEDRSFNAGFARTPQTNSVMLLDPLFWQTLGKALGWKKVIKYIVPSYSKEEFLRMLSKFKPFEDTQTIEKILRMDDESQWIHEWHRFIDHLAEGKDAESFFQSL